MDTVVERDVAVPLPDGTVLRADLYRPDTRDRLPTILQRTPYGKSVYPPGSPADGGRLVEAGYNLLVQDVRGRFASPGRFEPFGHEGRDGADTIGWIAAQPWSDGTVAMLGSSYEGAVQWAAAARDPAPLRAFAPHVTSADFYEGWTYQGGAFQLGFCLRWVLADLVLAECESTGSDRVGMRGAVQRTLGRLDAAYRRPWTALPVLDTVAPYYRTWLEHPSYDDFWRATAVRERYAAVRAPSLNIGGWYDIFVAGTIANYVGHRRYGAPGTARLIVGPWSHCLMSGVFPQRAYGPAADAEAFDLTAAHQAWFDEHLRGKPPGDDAPVRLFVTGADEWRGFADWPPPEAVPVRYHLHSGGRARTAAGDGVLAPDAPGDERPDAFRYDPARPVPTVGGCTLMAGMLTGEDCGPLDQRAVEARPDVLCYTTPALTRPVEVIGPVSALLYVSSSAPDTDVTAKLVDVAADGRAEILCDGILRARYRDSLTEPRPMRPGAIYPLRVDVGVTAHTFRAGHRIRLEVSSSNFPRFDPNPNTGGDPPTMREVESQPAVNQVHHDGRHPSHLELYVVDADR